MTQPESRLQRKIQDEIRKHGGFVFKVHGGPMMMTGLPDLIVCWHGLFIGLEVKMPGNDASTIQRLRGQQIREAGGRAYIVRSVQEALDVLERCESDAERPADVTRTRHAERTTDSSENALRRPQTVRIPRHVSRRAGG